MVLLTHALHQQFTDTKSILSSARWAEAAVPARVGTNCGALSSFVTIKDIQSL